MASAASLFVAPTTTEKNDSSEYRAAWTYGNLSFVRREVFRSWLLNVLDRLEGESTILLGIKFTLLLPIVQDLLTLLSLWPCKSLILNNRLEVSSLSKSVVSDQWNKDNR